MKTGKYRVRDLYRMGPLIACTFLLAACTFPRGAAMEAGRPPYDIAKPEPRIEFRKGRIERAPIVEGIEGKGMPRHEFPTLGVYLGGKIEPYITYIYENEQKKEAHEPAMTLISTMDNGQNNIRITHDKGCGMCHPTSILKYGESGGKISF